MPLAMGGCLIMMITNALLGLFPLTEKTQVRLTLEDPVALPVLGFIDSASGRSLSWGLRVTSLRHCAQRIDPGHTRPGSCLQALGLSVSMAMT